MYTPRSNQSQSDYERFKEMYRNDPERLLRFDLAEETIVREFTHWVIIKNRFPYDNMAKRNDLLVSREPAADLYSTSQEAQTEFHEIIKDLAGEGTYDARIENFPGVTSVQTQFHVHLVTWHNSTH